MEEEFLHPRHEVKKKLNSRHGGSMNPKATLDDLTALAVTSGLGQPLSDPETCPDGEGQMILCEQGMALYHPDLGAAPIPGGFAEAWKNEQRVTSPLGYPLGAPKPLSGKPKMNWQEFENGVLVQSGNGHVERILALPMGKGSLSVEDLARFVGDWLQRLITGRPEISVIRWPTLLTLVDFHRHQGELLPRGHAFHFQVLYRKSPFPAVEVSVTCELRWSAVTGKTALTGWLDGYDYEVDLPTGWSWVMRRETIDAAVGDMVIPWLRKPQVFTESPQKLLCAKVFADGGLHAFALPK
jgi:hypothetical protein